MKDFTDPQYLKRDNRYFNVANSKGYELHVFHNAIFSYNSMKARELTELPNLVINKLLKITNIYVSKKKIIIQALQRRVNREILIGLDKQSFEIREVKVYNTRS